MKSAVPVTTEARRETKALSDVANSTPSAVSKVNKFVYKLLL
jgi:hypothetical protein